MSHSGTNIDVNSKRSVDILTRHIRLFGKFFRRLQQLSPIRFSKLSMCNDLILFYWSQVVEATGGPPEQIAGKRLLPFLSNQSLYLSL